MELIDNSTSTLADWFTEHAGDEIRVATGFFTLDGLATLLSTLPADGQLQLVAAREIPTGNGTLDGLLEDEENASELNHDLQNVYDALNQRLEVRVQDDLHAKLYLTSGRGVMGSSNVTIGGLKKNLELNWELPPEIVDQVTQWFEELWQNSDPFTNQTRKAIEQSSAGKDLVDVPLNNVKQLNRTYGGMPGEVGERADDLSLPSQLARLDAIMAPTEAGDSPVHTFTDAYDYYEDLLEEAAQQRTRHADDFSRLHRQCSKNTNHLWKVCNRAGEPCSVPIDPGGKLWLLDWFIEQEGKVPTPDDLRDRHGGEGPVLMVNLWENQANALKAWLRSGRDGIVEMATATGKTVVGLAAIVELCGTLSGFDGPRTRDANVLVVVHTRALREQWQDEIQDKLDVSIPWRTATDRRVLDVGTGQIEIETPQYIAQNRDEFTDRRYDLVIYDEVHHYSRPQGWGQAIDALDCPTTLGLTATIGDVERRALERHLGEVVYRYGLSDAQSDGIIPDFDLFFHPVEFTDEEQAQVDELNRKIQRISSKLSDDPQTRSLLRDYGYSVDESTTFLPVFQQAYTKVKRASDEEELPDGWRQLMSLLGDRRRIEYSAEQSQAQAIDLAQEYVRAGRKVVIFSMRVDETAKPIADAIKKSRVIHGEQDEDTIEKRLNAFREWDRGALVAAKLLDEGVDLPDAEVGINVAGTKTRLHLVQRIGRLLRREGTAKPTFHHFMMADNEAFYRELAPVEPTAVEPSPSPSIKRTLPFKVGTVRVGGILESLSSEDAKRLLASDRSVTEMYRDDKWWLEILKEEYPYLWEAALQEKANKAD